MNKPYEAIVAHYESCLERYGDTHRGVDWPTEEGALERHKVMLEGIRTGRDTPVSLLDFGCGTSHLYETIKRQGLAHISYAGLDLSPRFVEAARAKFPHVDYFCVDILDEKTHLPQFDYVVMNGVFTEKRDLSFEGMLEYFQRVVKRTFQISRVGLAFNVMSKHVDWERGDLFHLPFDTLAAFLRKEVSRNFVFRSDYQMFEYTTYVYR